QEEGDLLRRELLGEGGEAADVGEEDDGAPLDAAEADLAGGGRDLESEGGGEVALEVRQHLGLPPRPVDEAAVFDRHGDDGREGGEKIEVLGAERAQSGRLPRPGIGTALGTQVEIAMGTAIQVDETERLPLRGEE